MVDLILLAYDLTGMYKITNLVRYGDNSQEVNEVVVIGVNEKGERDIRSFKLASSQLGVLQPYHRVDVLGEKDHLTKILFLKYMDANPNQRFFQAIRNFTEEYLIDEAKFLGYTDDPAEGPFVDTFYVEADEKLKIGEKR